VFLDILLSASTGMSSAHELDVLLEAWGIGTRAVGVPLDKFDRVRLLLLSPPCLELGEVRKCEVIACSRCEHNASQERALLTILGDI
jgi:hypothetical protein